MNRIQVTTPSGLALELDEPSFPVWEEVGWRDDAAIVRQLVRSVNGQPPPNPLDLTLVDFDAVAAVLGESHASDEDIVDGLERMRPEGDGYVVDITVERVVKDAAGVEVFERTVEASAVFREPRMSDLQAAADAAVSMTTRIANTAERLAAARSRETSILIRRLLVSVNGRAVTYESARIEWPLTLRQTEVLRACLLTRTRASDEAKAAVVRSVRAVTS